MTEESVVEIPFVTVVTSVFKKRDTIIDSVRSVCFQDYPNIEYIVIDDGPNSVDDNQVISFIRQSKIKKYQIIHNEKNQGISFSLNKAFEKSIGQYIVNLSDDDCFYDERVISDIVKEFEKTCASVITSKRAVYDSSLTELRCIEPSEQASIYIKTKRPKELFEVMSGYNLVFGCVTAKTRSIIVKYPYDPSYRIIEDYPIIMKMLRNDVSIHYLDRVTIAYREGGISSVGNIDSRYLEESDRIFKNEVLPYARNKLVAIIKYMKWKINVHKARRKMFN